MNDQVNKFCPDELTPFSPIELDRLVDGELSASARNDLLQRMQDKPAGWKQCALAFLESQLWAADMNHIAAGSDGAEQDIVVRTASLSSNDPSSGLNRAGPSSNQWKIAMGWLATAAALLVAFGLGRQINRPAIGPTSPATGTLVKETPVRSPMNLPAATEQWLTSSQLPFEIERSLKRLGADVQQEQGWVLRRGRDGRQVVVPYRDVQIVPVRGPAY